MAGNGYATTSRKKILEYLMANSDRTVTVTDIDQYLKKHDNEEHLHLKCVSCGCIIHLECAFMDEIAEHVLKDHGFTLQCKNSIIYGLCRECRKKQDRE